MRTACSSLRLALAFGLLELLVRPAARAQKAPPAAFAGATADMASYSAVYQIDTGDPAHIRMTLRNLQNALDDPRLKGKLHLELVAHGNGVAVFRRDQPYEAELKALQQRGVLLAQCLNTLREKKIAKEELWPFVSYVPSGNGELIIRQQQGWAILHP